MTTLRATAPSPARTGVWIGIGAVAMSFAAYTSALMVRQGGATDWVHLRLPPVLYVNTVVLLASSVTLLLGRRRVLAGWPTVGGEDARNAGMARQGVAWLAVTLALGLLFLAGQVLAWRQLAAQGLYLATTPGSAFFYVFTVLHALHVTGGIMALAYAIRRLHVAVDAPPLGALSAVALYWHFMGALWLYLLAILALRL